MYWYCEEKLDIGHSSVLGLKGLTEPHRFIYRYMEYKKKTTFQLKLSMVQAQPFKSIFDC